MPKRRVIFAENEHYHIYNRSTGAVSIFKGNLILKRITSLIDFYRYPQKLRYSKFSVLPRESKRQYEKNFRELTPIVKIYTFAVMPNHYHFLLKQTEDDGIVKFISNLQNSYAKYFNIKHKRFGSVFQGPFKAKHIEKDSYLLQLSRYIHLNPVTSFIIKIEELDRYPWTSFPNYLGGVQNRNDLINSSFLTKMLGSKDKYKKFVCNQADYQKNLDTIKGLLLE